MLRALLAALVVVAGAIGAVAYFALFIVHVNEQAIVLEFGKPVRIISEPGLFWKIPVVQTVDYFDKRILDLDTAPETPRRRCLCALPHHRSAAVLPIRA